MSPRRSRRRRISFLDMVNERRANGPNSDGPTLGKVGIFVLRQFMFSVLLLLALIVVGGANAAWIYPQRLPQGGVADHCAGLLQNSTGNGHTLLIIAGGQATRNQLPAAVVALDLSTSQFLTLPALDTPRYAAACSTSRDEFAVFGGATNPLAPEYTSTIERYSAMGDKVEAQRNLTTRRQFLGFGTNAGGIVGGGYGDGQYYASIESVVQPLAGAALVPARDGHFSQSYQTQGGHWITAFAGGAVPTPLATIDLFNHTSGRLVSQGAPFALSQARFMLCGAVTSDGAHALYIGGRTAAGTASNVVDRIDTLNNALSYVLQLRQARERCSAASYGPFVYIAGGWANQTTALASVEVIDTRTWTVTELVLRPLPNATGNMASVSVPGVGAMFIGGYNLIDFRDTIVVYSCGDGKVDSVPDELCDGSPNCRDDCTGCTNGLEVCIHPTTGLTSGCIDVRYHPEYCGACLPPSTKNCSALPNAVNASCYNGQCVFACPPGRVDCDGDWRNGCELDDTQSNNAHCGACNTTCNTTGAQFPNGAAASCVNGTCQLTACQPPWTDCDGLAGCEVDLSTNLDHCGWCGLACRPAALGWPNVAATVCQGGFCLLAQCAAGWAHCNLNVSDGCEVNTWSDWRNCGRCLNNCAVTPGGPHVDAWMCNGGVECLIVNCSNGWADYDGNTSNGCEVDLNPPRVTDANPPPAPVERDDNWWWWILLVCILVAILAAIMVGGYLWHRRKQAARRHEAAARAALMAQEKADVNQ